MNWNNVFTIAGKDIREARGNRAVWLPMLIVPLIFVVVLPLGFIIGANTSPESFGTLTSDPDMRGFFERMPSFMAAQLEGLNGAQATLKLMLGFFFAPFFLIIPLMFSTVIAAESFAGERERKTIEALLYTPASDGELFVGKMVAAGAPSVLITWACFLAYAIVVNAGAYTTMGGLWFPVPTWYPLIFWVAPGISLLGIAFTVLISAKNPTFMGAYQSSASLVVLVLGMVIGQATGLLYLSVGLVLAMGAVVWLAAAAMTMIAVRSFNRSKLLAGN